MRDLDATRRLSALSRRASWLDQRGVCRRRRSRRPAEALVSGEQDDSLASAQREPAACAHRKLEIPVQSPGSRLSSPCPECDCAWVEDDADDEQMLCARLPSSARASLPPFRVFSPFVLVSVVPAKPTSQRRSCTRERPAMALLRALARVPATAAAAALVAAAPPRLLAFSTAYPKLLSTSSRALASSTHAAAIGSGQGGRAEKDAAKKEKRQREKERLEKEKAKKQQQKIKAKEHREKEKEKKRASLPAPSPLTPFSLLTLPPPGVRHSSRARTRASTPPKGPRGQEKVERPDGPPPAKGPPKHLANLL